MGMELRTAPERYLIGDPVGALPTRGDGMAVPTYGRVIEVSDEEIMIRTADGELTGPWIIGSDVIFFDVTAHADYPHHPGTLYDCPGCEAIMEKDDHGDYVNDDAAEQG